MYEYLISDPQKFICLSSPEYVAQGEWQGEGDALQSAQSMGGVRWGCLQVDTY